MKIVFTGGGTAGHAMVNRILIPYIQEKDPDCQIIYIGSQKGMEREIISVLSGVPFFEIHTGKLRRYFSIDNLKDFFRVCLGFRDALKILKRERPQLVYAAGGYVTVPVVWAARVLRIPVFLRETDYSIGLANKLCLPFAKKIFLTFPNTQKAVKHTLSSFPGMIVRPELFDSTEKGIFFPDGRPVCLVMGGSLGADKINTAIWNNLKSLVQKYNILHICGKGNRNTDIPNSTCYYQIEFTTEIGPYLSIADVVISRCGSNAISECLSLGKAMVCIPIPAKHSRGDQEHNASFAIDNGNAVLLPQTELTAERLLTAISNVLNQDMRLKYSVTKSRMIQRITQHAGEVWREALAQFEKDLIMQAQGYTRVNTTELSDHEDVMFAEVIENYGI